MTVLVFAGCLEVGLFADDHALLGAVGRGAGWTGPLPVGSGVYYRPLVVATLVPAGVVLQHGISLLLHVLCSLLILGIARGVGCRTSLALVSALLFVTHPLVVAPVYWLAARGDLLCTTLVLTAVWLFLTHLGGGPRWLLAAVGLAVLLAPLAKESGLMLVPVLAILWMLSRLGVLPMRRPPERGRSGFRALLVYALVAAGVGALLALAFWRHAPSRFWSGPAGAGGVLLVAVNAVVLRIDELDLRRWAYAFPWLRTAGVGLLLLGTLAVTSCVARARGRRGILELVLLAALPVLPLLPLMTLGWARERQMYLSWALLVVALACLAGRWRRQGPLAAVGLLLVPLCIWGSWAGGRVWQDNAAYLERSCDSFRHVVAGAPPGSPVVLVDYPFSRAEVPLYSNDVRHALHRCLHGGAGRLERLQPYGAVVVADARADPGRVVQGETVGRAGTEPVFERRIEAHAGYFRLGRGHRTGVVYQGPSADLVITAVDPFGDVAAFRLVPDPRASVVFVGLGPGGFRSLGSGGREDRVAP